MKQFIHNLKIFYRLTLYAIKTAFHSKVGAIGFTLGKLLRFGFFFFFVLALATKTRILKGYGANEVLFVYMTYNIIDTLSQLLFREVYRFRYLVTSGGLDTILVKPYHPFVRILLGGIDFFDLLILFPYVGIALFFGLKTTPGSVLYIGLYFLLLLNSLIVATAFHIFVLCLGVLTTEVDHAILIYRDITSLGRLPMEIYKEPIRAIFTFIVPVGIMISFPAKALFGMLTPLSVIFAVCVSVSLFFLSLLLWDYAIKRYQSWGG